MAGFHLQHSPALSLIPRSLPQELLKTRGFIRTLRGADPRVHESTELPGEGWIPRKGDFLVKAGQSGLIVESLSSVQILHVCRWRLSHCSFPLTVPHHSGFQRADSKAGSRVTGLGWLSLQITD